MIDNLDCYYILEKFRYSCYIKVNVMMMNMVYKFYFLQELLDYIKGNWQEYENDMFIVLYYIIFCSLEQEDDDLQFYKCLKYMLVNEIFNLSKDEQGDFYFFVINYCIWRINGGDREF